MKFAIKFLALMTITIISCDRFFDDVPKLEWSIENATGISIKGSKLFFSDPQVGYAIDYAIRTTYGIIFPQVAKTTNGGRSWTRSIPNEYWGAPVSYYYTDAYFTDNQNGFIVCPRDSVLLHGPEMTIGTVFKTTDGGLTWRTTNFGFGQPLTSVVFTSKLTGYTLGSSHDLDGEHYSAIYKTVDGGLTWNAIQQPGSWLWIKFQNSEIGYAYNWSGLMKTTDAGVTWTNLPSWSSLIADKTTDTLFFSNLSICNNRLFSLYRDTTVFSKQPLYTSVDGLNWTFVVDFGETNTADHHVQLTDIDFSPSGNLGFAFGEEWRSGRVTTLIYKTVDKGTTWTREVLPPNIGAVNHVSIVNDNIAYAVDENGLLLKYTRQ